MLSVTVNDIDSGKEYTHQEEQDRQRIRTGAVEEMVRQPWGDGEAAAPSVPLPPLGSSRSGNGAGENWKGGQGQKHTILSRTPSERHHIQKFQAEHL